MKYILLFNLLFFSCSTIKPELVTNRNADDAQGILTKEEQACIDESHKAVGLIIVDLEEEASF